MILSAGTLIPEKGFEYVIRACRVLADQGTAFDCLIVGDGPDRGKLEELVGLLELSERVTLSPYRPQEELRNLFRQAAVFTLPCIFPLNGNVDVIPLVLQEAMAMARPVVSTPVSGIPELIQNGVNGLLAAEKDHEALAAALARILRDPELAARLGTAARETVIQRFDVAVNGAELAAILRREVPELGVGHGESGVRSSVDPTARPPSPNSQPSTARLPLRVAWVVEIPVPYRIGLYRRLRDEAGLDLKLLFCSTTQKDRDWTVALYDVPHVVLRGAALSMRPREQFFLRVNPPVWRELSRFGPDVVVVGGYAHLTMQAAMLWCRRTRTPYLINSESHSLSRGAQGAGGRWGQTGVRRLLDDVKRFYVSGAAAGLPAGTLAREYLLSLGGPPDRMFTLPNTCDVAAMARDSARARVCRESIREELGLGDGPVLLYVGRLTPVKGLETLLRAFAEVRDGVLEKIDPAEHRTPITQHRTPTLLLVGEGEQRAELEALAAQLGIADRVRFAGSRPWSVLPGVYAAADLFVLPSLFEPWGAVVIEAMACGLPVIVSDQVGCAPDLVRRGENGWIVPAGDVTALTEAIRKAFANPDRLDCMGTASARLAPAWGEDACTKSFVEAVRAALASRAAIQLRMRRGNSEGYTG